MRLRLAIASLLVVLSACSPDSEGEPFRLDGSPRYPDDQGVLTEVSFDEITLDGERTYTVSENLRSFSTMTQKLEPMLSRRGQFVQVGLDGDEVIWMAGFARVVPGDPPSVYYTGRLVDVDEDLGIAIFRDGTVLQLSRDLDVEVSEGEVVARINAETGRIVELSGS